MKDLTKQSKSERKRIEAGIVVNDRRLSKYSYSQLSNLRKLDLPDGTVIAVFPDMHSDSFDPKAGSVVKQMIRDIRPNVNLFLGDIVDQPDISRWPQPVNKASTNVNKELETTGRLVTELHLVSGASLSVLISGNHDRLQAFLNEAGKALADLDNRDGSRVFSMKERLKLNRQHNILYIAGSLNRGGYDGGVVINGKLVLHHGNGSSSQPGAAARKSSELLNCSVGTGHTHKAGGGAKETTGKGVIQFYEFGFLAMLRHWMMAYMANINKNWQLCLGMITVYGGVPYIELITIGPRVQVDGSEALGAEWRGKEYTNTDF